MVVNAVTLSNKEIQGMMSARRFAVYSIVAVNLCALGTHPARAQWDVSQTTAPAVRYLDPKGLFSFDIPAKWQVEVKAESTVFRWDSAAVTLFAQAGPVAPTFLASEAVKRILAVATDFREVSDSDSAIAGVVGMSEEFTAKGAKGEATHGQIVAIQDKQASVTLVLTAPEVDYPYAYTLFTDAIATMVFNPLKPTTTVKLAERTRVKVTILEGLSSNHSKKGEEVRYEVAEDVLGPNREVLISKGTAALGTVTRASRRGIFGKPGKLNVSIDFVRAVDETRVPLRANEDMSKSGKNNVTGVAAATILVAPIGLLINGRDAGIKKGTQFDVFVNADTLIDVSKAKTPGAAGGRP